MRRQQLHNFFFESPLQWLGAMLAGVIALLCAPLRAFLRFRAAKIRYTNEIFMRNGWNGTLCVGHRLALRGGRSHDIRGAIGGGEGREVEYTGYLLKHWSDKNVGFPFVVLFFGVRDPGSTG